MEIVNRKYSVRRELLSTYFCRCDDVTDPLIVFNPESHTFFRDLGKYFCIALAQDVAGFNSDKDVAIALKHFFTTALEIPTEEPIEEQIHIPTEEVSVEKPRAALVGYVAEQLSNANSRNADLLSIRCINWPHADFRKTQSRQELPIFDTHS
jgi:hypothetical protein